MYAVIASPKLWSEIEQTILSQNEDILFKAVDEDINLSNELERVSRIAVRHLIIDITCLENPELMIPAIRKYRIIREATQIVIIAPDYVPGNALISALVRMGIYDIIAPKLDAMEEKEITNSLLSVLEKPSTYSKAVRWDTGAAVFDGKVDVKEKVKVEKVYVQEKETVIRTEILGTIVIAVAGVEKNVGCTHTVLSIAHFLSRHVNKYKVAVLEAGDKDDFRYFNIDCPAALKAGSFAFKNIDFYDSKTNILELLALNYYNYIILDIGVIKSEIDNTLCKNYQEMFRANLSILVSGSKPWQLDKLLFSLCKDKKMTDNTDTKKWFLYFTNTDDKTFESIKEELDYAVYKATYSPEFFKCYSDNDIVLEELLQPVLPKGVTVIKDKKNSFARNLASIPGSFADIFKGKPGEKRKK